jgi:ribonuclease HII
MPPDSRAIAGVDDSKRLTAAARTRLAEKIRARCVSFGIGAASVREIDRYNIYQATVIAMRRALMRLSVTPHHVLVDGKPFRTLEIAHTAIVDGDDKCYSIACASILAKVTRDRIMQALSIRHPNYLWDRNVGYSTAAHMQGLAAHGATAHHRRSFMPVSQLFLDLSLTIPAETGESAEFVDDPHAAGD